MKVICIGHLAYDTTLPVSRYPIENTKMRTTYHMECGGGPAGNAAYLLGSWKEDVDICGLVGDDYQGNKIVEEFIEVGVSTKYIVKSKEHQTDYAFIMANVTNGTRTIVTSANPKEHPLIPVNDKYDGILIDGEELLTSQKVLKENPEALSIIDAGKYTTNVIALSHKVKILACSKNFAEEFSHEKIDANNLNQLILIHQKLEEEFQNIVIITLEEFGSFTKIDNEYKIIPSIKVNTIDSTGAGDMFHGALMYFLLHKYSLEEAISLANVTGALATTKIGSKNSVYNLKKVLYYGGSDDII